MELFQFSWGGGSDDERYLFVADTDRESVMNLMESFCDAGGDLHDCEALEEYASECGVILRREFQEEPTFIHEDELER